MARKCEICGKGPQFGNRVSHSNRKTRHKFNPNIQSVRIEINGVSRKVKICTSCLRSLKKSV
ncbi:ribosomal protein L28 [Nautilia profundicola AmH]|jgi:large subunit ribosomal protein L28|uniref:Large ribosomal subunit protein bL28 n=1 Tax=Nautilia profundicola (strain ATCC BAA-1463 / DSM 18972 / AmH) TaxID=598659 RepID=RL28_NAUPA|nr:50S ribosomal protein L28 [Nautilia profundicola]B9L6I1.1 RecName: Full=Large ribosomal subunit protein bL28; AltName: Full=50S ribosomal protein L28 [Nautilia profundicola AmH]ACM93566.1 ribosomal protein L28 [Nautilia profundicola AmH]